jgi:acyl-CoA oxidase
MRSSLRTLAMPHGVTSVARASDFYVGAGALPAGSTRGLRAARLQLCSQLMAEGVLRRLCDGFGIPDHCLQAPIAFNWREL